jgi:hypothetical protein
MHLEYAQGHVPGRMASGWDMAANTAGVVLGILAGRLARCVSCPPFGGELLRPGAGPDRRKRVRPAKAY